jgi:hypothetical protein
VTESKTGWPKGRIGWIAGTVVLFALGVLIGLILRNVWLGIMIAAIVSIGWIIAYESWRGGRLGTLDDPDDNGAQL